MTIDEDIQFWSEAAFREHQRHDMRLLAFGIAAGLRMAKQDHAGELTENRSTLSRPQSQSEG